MSEGSRASAARFVSARLALLVIAAAGTPAVARAQDPSCDRAALEVRGLEFDGNRTFPDRELALRVSTTPSTVWRRALRVVGTRRCLDRQELGLDIARLRVFYRARGFFDAQVDTVVSAAGDQAVRVRFRIVEGEPVLIDSVNVQGVESLTPEAQRAVRGAVGIAAGDRFDQDTVRASIEAIRASLRDRGFPRADVALETEVEYAARRARVGFTVVPGQIAHLGRIDVRVEPVEGKPQQIGDPIVRRLAGLREGALYRESDLSVAHRNLYGTSAYRHVDVRTAIDSVYPRGDSLRVLISLREDLTRQLDAEAGWGTLDCFRARTQLIDRNFLSGARRLELTSQVSKIGFGYPLDQAKGLCRQLRRDPFSDTLHYFVGATLRQPAFRGTRFTPAFSLYRERRGEYLAYLRSTLIGGEASAEREIARLTPLRLAYTIEYGRTQAEPALLCFIFSQCDLESQEQLSGSVRSLAVASAAVARARVDNLMSPTRGDRFRVELRSASRLIGSDRTLEFTKGWIDGAMYRPFFGGTLAARLRLGAVVGNSLDQNHSIDFIPPQERLYAGGATSVRGFQQNELGAVVYIAEDPPIETETVRPDGEPTLTISTTRTRRVVPTGGNALFVGNLDWRLRSPFYPEFLTWSLFTDVGEVWTRGQAGLGFRSLKWTPGVGMRLATFVGPVQLNVAYNPYLRPAGPVFYDAPVRTIGERTIAPLFCVTPGNDLRVVERSEDGQAILQEQGTCPSGFRPPQSRSFFQRLTFTLSIGPDF